MSSRDLPIFATFSKLSSFFFWIKDHVRNFEDAGMTADHCLLYRLFVSEIFRDAVGLNPAEEREEQLDKSVSYLRRSDGRSAAFIIAVNRFILDSSPIHHSWLIVVLCRRGFIANYRIDDVVINILQYSSRSAQRLTISLFIDEQFISMINSGDCFHWPVFTYLLHVSSYRSNLMIANLLKQDANRLCLVLPIFITTN